MKLNLQDSVVLVTGGTKGIGRGIVQSFLEEDAKVAYCARSITGNEFQNPNAKGYQVDLTKPDEIKSWVKKVVEDFGGIDVVVSNGSHEFVPCKRSSAF
jgi:3-oxoacyl-[acyl-carrier protein] reductase